MFCVVLGINKKDNISPLCFLCEGEFEKKMNMKTITKRDWLGLILKGLILPVVVAIIVSLINVSRLGNQIQEQNIQIENLENQILKITRSSEVAGDNNVTIGDRNRIEGSFNRVE